VYKIWFTDRYIDVGVQAILWGIKYETSKATEKWGRTKWMLWRN